MADVLSSAASVITIAACAGDLTKLIFKAFREASLIPFHLHQLLRALESLQITLLDLQRCEKNLNPDRQFSPHFRQRLHDCLDNLKTFHEKITKIDKNLDQAHSSSRKLGRKTRRSWQKVKWLTTGERETNLFLEHMRLYQAEFSLELLTLLISIHGSSPRQQAANTTSKPNIEGSVFPYASNIYLQPQTQPSGIEASTFTWATQFDGLGPQLWIRACFNLGFEFIFCDYMLRGGPVVTKLLNARDNATCSPITYQNIGIGLHISLCLPKICRKRLGIEIMIVWNPRSHRTRLALLWNLDCVRIVPQQAIIFQYVRVGSIDGVKRLLKCGQASVRDITRQGITLLHTASGLGHLDLVEFLIEQGADVNAGDEDGETPLHRATSLKKNDAVAMILIEKGADLLNVAAGNRTPLHAIFNSTIGRVLTSSNIVEDVGLDSDGMSITHFLAWSSQTTPEVFERGRARDTMDLWSADSSGRTCLHYAASRGNLNLLQYLIDRATLVERCGTDDNGQSVIHYAARSSRMVTVVELLRANGSNLSAKDAGLQNVLHHAAKWRELEAIEKLTALDNEKCLLSPDKMGQMPSDIAYKVNSGAVYLYLHRLESIERRAEDVSKPQVGQVSRRLISATKFHAAWQLGPKARGALQNARSLHWFKNLILASSPVCIVLIALLTLEWRAIQQLA